MIFKLSGPHVPCMYILHIESSHAYMYDQLAAVSADEVEPSWLVRIGGSNVVMILNSRFVSLATRFQVAPPVTASNHGIRRTGESTQPMATCSANDRCVYNSKGLAIS